MFKLLFALFITCIGSSYAKTCDIPETIRRDYAEKFNNAFILQCNGLSTKAFWMFDEASKAATKAGEEAGKINALWDLFRWYRKHGTMMLLFAVEPTGDNIIHPDGTRIVHKKFRGSQYNSEYGKSPEQAAHVREFMFGVANTISGVFCIVVGGGIVTAAGVIGLGLATSGIYMMFNALNACYSDYERAKLDLQVLEKKLKTACEKDK